MKSKAPRRISAPTTRGGNKTGFSTFHFRAATRLSNRWADGGMVYNKEQSCNSKEEAMPVVNHSSYNSPIWLRNGHLQTIWPVLFRNPPLPSLWRERLETPDGDLIDIDHIRLRGIRSGRVAILSHGLEGTARAGTCSAWPKRSTAEDGMQARIFRVTRRNEPHASALPRRETDDLHCLVVQYCVSLGYGASYLWGSAWAAIKRSSISGARPTIPSQASAAVAVSVRATWKAR